MSRPLNNSTLPDFEVKGLDLELDGRTRVCVILRCKRKGCGGWFIVRKADLRRREYGTMPCPHCAAVSKIPDALTLANL